MQSVGFDLSVFLAGLKMLEHFHSFLGIEVLTTVQFLRDVRDVRDVHDVHDVRHLYIFNIAIMYFYHFFFY